MSEPLTIEHLDKSLVATEKRITTYIDDRFDKSDERLDKFETHFDETMRSVAETLHTITGILNDHTAILNDHTRRLEQLEKLLDLERRFEQYKSYADIKFRKIGEHLAMPELTV